MKLNKIVKIITYFIIAILVYWINPAQVQATEISSVVKVEKYSYSEEANELDIIVSLNEGISIKNLSFSLNYNTSILEYISHNIYNAENQIENCSITNGGISIKLKDSENSKITSSDKLCLIKFKINNAITLEENIPNNLFKVDSASMENDEGKINTIEIIEIKPMASEVKNITVQNLEFNKNEYLNNEEIKLISGQAIITYNTNSNKLKETTREVNLQTLLDANGNKINIEKTGSWIANYNNPYVSVSYGQKTYKIGIIVKKYELSNNKLTILYGHSITENDLEGYKIIIKTVDGTILPNQEKITNINITPEMISYNKYGDVEIEQNTYINYLDEIKLPLTVILKNYVEKIYLTKNNITINYGSKLNVSTLTNEYKVVAKMANGELGASGYIRDYINKNIINTKKEGKYKTTINFQGKNATFTVIVVDKIIGVKLENEEKEKIQKEYNYGEKLLKLNNAKLTIVKLSGTTKIDLTTDLINGYYNKTIGTQKLTIQYGGYILDEEIEITVNDYIVDIILIKPNRVSYLPGENLDLTGATVQTLSASGKIGEPVPVTENMVSGFNSNQMGAQRLTVSYGNFQKDFDILLIVMLGEQTVMR